MKGLNLSNFKKMNEDKNSATMIHEKGHTLIISKGSLPALQRKQLEALPMHEQHFDEGGTAQAEPPLTDEERATNQMNTMTSGSTVPIEQPSPAPSPEARNPASVSSDTQTAGLPFSFKGLQQEKAANIEEATAKGKEGAAETKALGNMNAGMKSLPTSNDIISNYSDQQNQLMEALQNKKIDPNHYWQDHSKVAAGLGLLLAGGGGNVGAALDIINNGINRDIDTQKSEKNNIFNLWKMNREALGNDLAANAQTYNQLATMTQYRIQEAAAEQKGPLAFAAAHLANAKIQQEIDVNKMRLGYFANTSDDQDPANKLGQGVRLGIIPAGEAPKVADEIKNRADIVSIQPQALSAFDEAAKEVRPLTGGTNTSGTSFVPGMESANQKSFEQLLGTTVKETEGTARAGAFQMIHDKLTPNFGDDDSTIATKRAAVQKYFASHAAAPLSQSYGINLDKYPSTRLQMGPVKVQQKSTPRGNYERKIINGKAYMVPVR